MSEDKPKLSLKDRMKNKKEPLAEFKPAEKPPVPELTERQKQIKEITEKINTKYQSLIEEMN